LKEGAEGHYVLRETWGTRPVVFSFVKRKRGGGRGKEIKKRGAGV